MDNTTCRICGSKDIYCIQETSLVKAPWMIVHVAYCKDCAKDIELFELQLRVHRDKRFTEEGEK